MKSIKQGIEDKENKTEDIRTLEKVNDNHFKLTVINEGQRICNVKEFDKKQLKEVYEDIVQNVNNLVSMKAIEVKKAKMLTDLPKEEEEKIEDFMHMLNQVTEFKDAEKSKAALPNFDAQIEFLERSQREIERIIPEVKR